MTQGPSTRRRKDSRRSCDDSASCTLYGLVLLTGIPVRNRHTEKSPQSTLDVQRSLFVYPGQSHRRAHQYSMNYRMDGRAPAAVSQLVVRQARAGARLPLQREIRQCER